MNPWKYLLPAFVLLCGGRAWALDIVPYEAESFARAQATGRVTALQFHSGWCPICVMQERGLMSLREDKALENVTVFQVDYMKDDAMRQRYRVTSFSTLVVFRGTTERARVAGEFQAEQLKQLFAKAQ
jgi:thiol-disulfide isomerase/thioredoxin